MTSHSHTTLPPFMPWNDAWLVGIHELDLQHRHLVGLLNQLHNAMSQGNGKNALNSVLSSLVSYTTAHFAAEERLMRQHGFPEYAAHKQEHERLAAKVLDFQREFESGRVAMSVEVMDFLRKWLQGHILGTDKKYVPFLSAKGVR